MTGTEIIVLNMIQDHLRSAAADVVMPAITKLDSYGSNSFGNKEIQKSGNTCFDGACCGFGVL